MPDLSPETRAALERSLACMLPLLAGVMGLLLGRQQPRKLPAALTGTLLCMPALLLLQRLNLYAGWWSFPRHEGVAILTIPVELWIGWSILWGAVPSLAFPELQPALTLPVLALLDLAVMPRMKATVHLNSDWLFGELIACVCVLLPSLILQYLTVRATRVELRACLQVIAAAGVFLYLPMELLVATHHAAGWHTYRDWPPLLRSVLVQCGFLLALPGLAAVQEFATIGAGTPLPFDPPRHLVTTGVYRYVANPIQLSCALVMLLWALLLRSPWLLMGPVLCLAYSAGIAHWDESVDLRQRFETPWSLYRSSVRAWVPRWKPYASDQAVLYIARDCGPCSTMRLFLEQHQPRSLRFEDAERLPNGSITRMRYCNRGESVEGVRAFARALEHLHLGWALVGALLRLPLIAPGTQLLLDVSGFGPMSRTVE